MRRMAILGVSALLFGACTATDRGDEVVRVVVDTDVGQDDAMALLFLLQHPQVRIEAVTVTGTGLAHCEPGVRNVLALLELAGASDVPVACGPDLPLVGSSPDTGAFPVEWREATDRLHGIELPESDRTPAKELAPDLLVATIRDADGPVTLLTLGPLTNVALALRAEPSLGEELERIVVMGGAVDVPGNALENPLAEFNVWIDPVAAQEVLTSGAEIDLVPLDATNQAPITAFFADALAEHQTTPVAHTVHALFEAQPHLVDGGFYFWDPLAAAVLVDRTLAAFEGRRITVLEGKPTIQGWTVPSMRGALVNVATSVDGLTFEREFLNTLNGGQVVSSTRPEPIASASISTSACEWESAPDVPAGLAAATLEVSAGASNVLAVVRLDSGRTIEDLEAWLEARDHVVTEEPPVWIVVAGFMDPRFGEIVPLTLLPGPHAAVCGDPAGRIDVVGSFDVAG